MNDTVKPLRFTLVLLLAILLLGCSMFMGISFGAKNLTIGSVWEAVFSYDRSLTAHQIIQEVRLPRVIAAALVGAAFAVAGALMQGVTRKNASLERGISSSAAFCRLADLRSGDAFLK
ncbi:Iron-uptake system permease protein FeuB [compost metagenome]